MNGNGNTFIILDSRLRTLRLDRSQLQYLCNDLTPHSIDQLIVLTLEKRDPASGLNGLHMSIFNTDGSEAEACGNAARCLGWLLLEETGSDTLQFRTRSGPVTISREHCDGRIWVDLGQPRFKWQDIPLAEPFHDTRSVEIAIGPIDSPALHTPSCVSMGNPHAIFWVNDVNEHDLARAGPMLENHPLFPEGANITLANVESRNHIRIRTWERGTGLTQACGTAACASAVAGHRNRRADRELTIGTPGGDLFTNWRECDDHVLLSGDVEFEKTGHLQISDQNSLSLIWRH